MRDKIKPVLLGRGLLAIASFVFFRTFSANANSGSRIIDRGESSYKGIRAVCDDKTGNLIYQAEGLAGPIAVVPCGCALPKVLQPGEPVSPTPVPSPTAPK